MASTDGGLVKLATADTGEECFNGTRISSYSLSALDTSMACFLADLTAKVTKAAFGIAAVKQGILKPLWLHNLAQAGRQMS